MSDDLIPVKRPQFELRDGRLFFLASRRPFMELNAEDEAIWRRIDGVQSKAQLDAEIPGAADRLHYFHQRGVCELVAASWPPNRRRVLVVEPHMDDAALSVGASMWKHRETCEFTIVTIAGRSNFTSYFELDRDFFDVARVTEIRRAESALAARLIGGEHVALNEAEAPLRFHGGNWTLDWYRHHHKQVDAFIMHPPTDREISEWTRVMARVLSEANAGDIWLPLGVGSHTDHELTRAACLRALAAVPVRANVFFYQDVPYATQFPAHTRQIVDALVTAGGELEIIAEDVGAHVKDKLHLLSIFGSQFKPEHMDPRVEEAARLASSHTGNHELFFKVDQLPASVDPIDLYSERHEVEVVVARLSPWYAKHRLVRRVRILSPVPVGRWEEDMTALLDALPEATLEVHVSAEYADETAAFKSPRLDVHVVEGREAAWIVRLADVAVSRPLPTILLIGEGLRPFEPVAGAVLPLSDVVSATRMHHVVMALQRVTAS